MTAQPTGAGRNTRTTERAAALLTLLTLLALALAAVSACGGATPAPFATAAAKASAARQAQASPAPSPAAPAVAAPGDGAAGAATGSASPRPARQPAAPPFGVSVRGEIANANVRALVVQAGVRWVRSSVDWSAIEPARGAYNWAGFDGHISTLAEMGVIPVVYVSGDPAWAASSRCGPIDKAPLSDFARFVSTLAQRYNGKTVVNGRTLPAVLYWQFYNEPDNAWTSGQASGFDGCWGGAGGAYAEMLAAAWEAVHTANPQAFVVFGGIAGESVDCPAGWECAGKPIFNFDINGGDFMDDVLAYMDAHPGSPFFDVFDFHYYPAFHSRWEVYGAGISGKAAYYAGRLASWGVERPMMCSEAGRRSDSGQKVDGVPGSDVEQSRYVARLFTQSMSADLVALLWFTLTDIVEPKQSGAAAWGLLTDSFQPKPSYRAYSTLTRTLAGLRYSGKAAVKGQMEGYLFEGDGRQTTVLWMKTGTGQIAIRAGQATIVALDGSETTVHDGGSGDLDRRADGAITLAVTLDPIIVRVP